MAPTRYYSVSIIPLIVLSSLTIFANAFTSPSGVPLSVIKLERQRRDWIDRSVNYYSKVMRKERRQIAPEEFSSEEFQTLAKKHYFALRKIKDGKHDHAEIIYRRIIDEIMNEEADGHCDHAKLAVTTLLLALHCQRMGDPKKARAVFLTFFRVAVVKSENEELGECACSAKVLGAYALFEMKAGNVHKSLEIAKKAVEFDEGLQPVLNWKQFRDADESRRRRVHRT